MKTVHGILSKNGNIRLAEPVEFEDDQQVFAAGGLPMTSYGVL